MRTQRVLLLDIETSPNIGYTWGKYEQDVIEFVQQWTILCFSFKWLGKKTQTVTAEAGEKPMLLALWNLLDMADIVVAQNGDRFDIRKINTRFLQHKMKPPAPYKTVDTLKVARKFAFNSNKLDDLGRDLNEGRKMAHKGFALWKGCMSGDKKSWAIMKKYNKQDVELLERIYLRMLPWITKHPNVSINGCPKCGSDNLECRGWGCNMSMRYRKYRCRDCGGWCKDTKGERFSEVVNV